VTTYILDASAILRFLDREVGWERVAQTLTEAMGRTVKLSMSAVQWGEVAGAVRKKRGVVAELQALGLLGRFPLQVEAATDGRAMLAAELKVDRKLGYADAFAAELAISLDASVLLTADYGFKAVEDLARIEFLPQK
jgi:predicted nucleic acid-binding protein